MIEQSSIQLPNIEREEDLPLGKSTINRDGNLPIDSQLEKTDNLKKEITRFRYRTGKSVLYIAMGAMGISVVMDLIIRVVGIESELLDSAFEAFKLIAMTVLGYIFGSDNSK